MGGDTEREHARLSDCETKRGPKRENVMDQDPIADEDDEWCLKMNDEWSEEAALEYARNDWSEVASDLYGNIKACVRDEFASIGIGECVLVDGQEVVPQGVELVPGWQRAIVLHVKNGNRERVMRDISLFVDAPVKPYVIGEYVVWQFPEPDRRNPCPLATKLSTSVFLPKWLTQYLYMEKGLSYKPDCDAVQYNLNADREFSYQYLATYFPRTFAEMTSIFDFAFENFPSVLERVGNNIAILDVGCGSGAAAAALIWSMKKARLLHVKKIEVVGLDGNENYLERFKELVPVIQANWSAVEIKVNIRKTDDVENSLRNLSETTWFDFIVSSKFIQELKQEDAYAKIVALCLARLKPGGMVCLLENYREGRTERNSAYANKTANFHVVTHDKLEFSVMQIPACPCVQEIVGSQVFINKQGAR